MNALVKFANPSDELKLALSLFGKLVRFKHLPADCNPTPIRVVGIFSSGKILLDGWKGEFDPHLFVVVEVQ